MADVLRLFYGGAPICFNEEGEADLRIEHAVSRQNGHWCDQFSRRAGVRLSQRRARTAKGNWSRSACASAP